MAYSKKTWVDRQVEHPGRRKLTSTGTTDVYDVTREEGLVIEEGDALNASTFNDLENRISSAFAEAATREVYPLEHSKSGTVHQLTGLAGITGAASCIFMAAAAFNAGDTFTVDGTAYTVQLSNGEEAEDNLFVSGAAVPVIVDTGAKKVNFKAAGSSVKLPAGTTIIWKIFTPETYDASVSDTFVPPVSGKYRVTVIAKGGNGGRSDPQDGAGGGGSGGWASSLLDLTTEDSVPVTVNPSISSFGSYMSATCGSNGSLSSNGTGGTASGGNLFTYNGINASGSLSSSAGVNGAPVSHPEDSIFLTDVYGLAGFGYYGYTDAGFAPYSKNGYAPFGAGGGGGKGNVNIENNSLREGGYGGKGAVIVEIAIEGVNV